MMLGVPILVFKILYLTSLFHQSFSFSLFILVLGGKSESFPSPICIGSFSNKSVTLLHTKPRWSWNFSPILCLTSYSFLCLHFPFSFILTNLNFTGLNSQQVFQAAASCVMHSSPRYLEVTVHYQRFAAKSAPGLPGILLPLLQFMVTWCVSGCFLH